MTASGEPTLRELLGKVIGSGPKSAEDMTPEQARSAFRRILDGTPDPTTLGAFLLANRWKGNTPEELAAFLDVMIEESVTRSRPSGRVVDCGANFDGKERTALLGLGGGLVAAAAGTTVVAHSGDRVPMQGGCAYKHVLDELGVPTDLTPAESAGMAEDVGFGFYYQPRYNPAVHALLDRREQMGVRTLLNTIETLANPARATIHVGSFYHLAFGKKLADTLARSERAGFDRAVFVQGVEGYDDVRPGYTKIGEWSPAGFDDREIRSAEFGMTFDTEDLAVDDVASDSARITREVLAGDRTDQFADAITLNAAVRLYAGGRVDDVEAGVGRARELLAGDGPADALAALEAFESA